MRTPDLLRGLVAQLADTTLRYLAEHAFRTAEDYGASVGVRDGAPLPDVPAVPKVYGVPGASSRLKRGQSVMVGFRGGVAGSPVVVGYPEGCKAEEVGLDAESVIRAGTEGAVEAVARAAPTQELLGRLIADVNALRALIVALDPSQVGTPVVRIPNPPPGLPLATPITSEDVATTKFKAQ
jgi:hypothetical protein